MSNVTCEICKSESNNSTELGEKVKHKKMVVHLFCLLLSSNLMQRADEDEELLGFLISDIEKEIRRASHLKCFYCKNPGASVGCCHKTCRRAFHLPCAVSNRCRFEFTGTYRSFCHQHHGLKNIKKHQKNETCSICLDTMGDYHPVNSVQSPCCNKNVWYHKLCLMEMAKTAGYFFKCPLCNDKKCFRERLSLRGIFIPDKDASWELEPNAYADLNEQKYECEAEVCKCPRGRSYDGGAKTKQFEIMICEYCGSRCAHRQCVNLTITTYVCIDCRPNDSDSDSSSLVIDITGQDYSDERLSQKSDQSASNDFTRDNNESDDCMDCSQITDLSFSEWFETNNTEVIDVDDDSERQEDKSEPYMTIDLTVDEE